MYVLNNINPQMKFHYKVARSDDSSPHIIYELHRTAVPDIELLVLVPVNDGPEMQSTYSQNESIVANALSRSGSYDLKTIH